MTKHLIFKIKLERALRNACSKAKNCTTFVSFGILVMFIVVIAIIVK